MDPRIILLIEDEPTIALILETVLSDSGFEVTTEIHAFSALAEIERRALAYQAIITDIDLGGALDGWQIARRARELAPEIPVIYMSGKSSNDWPDHGVSGSVMLQKPFGLHELTNALSTLLQRYSQARVVA